MSPPRAFPSLVMLSLVLLPFLARAGDAPSEKKEEAGAPVTRTIEGVTVAIDPATGRLVPPSGESRKRLVEALTRMIDQRVDDLIPERRPSGARFVRLDGRFANVSLATIAPDGKPRLQCVADPEAAGAWLEAVETPAPAAAEER